MQRGEQGLEGRWNYSQLLDFYARLLPEKQARMLDNYYNEDYSLAELADREEISRQAAHGLIQRGREELLRYEACLQLARRYKRQLTALEVLEGQQEALNSEGQEALRVLRQTMG